MNLNLNSFFFYYEDLMQLSLVQISSEIQELIAKKSTNHPVKKMNFEIYFAPEDSSESLSIREISEEIQTKKILDKAKKSGFPLKYGY